MDFIILKVNGQDVRHLSQEMAIEILQQLEEPISVEVVRRSSLSCLNDNNGCENEMRIPVAQSGGLCESTNNSLLSLKTKKSPHEGEICENNTMPVQIQSILPAEFLLDEEEEEEEDSEDEEEILFADEHEKKKRYNHILQDFTEVPKTTNNKFCGSSQLPIIWNDDSLEYENDQEYNMSLQTNSSTQLSSHDQDNFEWKYFNVLVRKTCPTDKFGLTLCYRSSCEEVNSTEVYVGEIDPSSCSYRSGQVYVGDRIIQINNQDIKCREHVVDLFKECGLEAKLTLLRPVWKAVDGAYRDINNVHTNSLPNEIRSTEALSDPILLSDNFGYLPDQDSGMGRTTDGSVRTEESSEQEGESEIIFRNSLDSYHWKKHNDLPNPFSVCTLQHIEETSSHLNAIQLEGINTASKLLDEELIHLNLLMESLSLHCRKLCSRNSKLHDFQGRSERTAPAKQPNDQINTTNEVLKQVNNNSRNSNLDNTKKEKPILRQIPRMGTRLELIGDSVTKATTSTSSKIMEAQSSITVSTQSRLVGRLQSNSCGNSLSISLANQPSSEVAETASPSDLGASLPTLSTTDMSTPQQFSQNTTIANWSIGTTAVPPEISFSIPKQKIINNKSSIPLLTTSSTDQQYNSVDSSQNHTETKVLIKLHNYRQTTDGFQRHEFSNIKQPSNTSGGSQVASLNNQSFSKPSVTRQSVNNHDNPIYEGMVLPLLSSKQMEMNKGFSNSVFQNRLYPYALYNYYDSHHIPGQDAETVSSNIYETPYASIETNEKVSNSNILFNTISPSSKPDHTTEQYTIEQCTDSSYQFSKQGDQLTNSASTLMEWVVKKRKDGTRYITRRPIRYLKNRILKERARRVAEERCGLTTDDDAQSEMNHGRYWNRTERRRQVEKSKSEKKRKPVTDKSKQNQTDKGKSCVNQSNRALVSLTTV